MQDGGVESVASEISKLLSETMNFQLSEVTEAITEYFWNIIEVIDIEDSSGDKEDRPELRNSAVDTVEEIEDEGMFVYIMFDKLGDLALD